MDLKTISEESPYTFKIIGRLDTNTAPELENFVGDLYTKNVKDIVVDLEECDFISSAGLRVIVAMQKRASSVKGTLEFKNTIEEVMDVFEMTGFDKILTLS